MNDKGNPVMQVLEHYRNAVAARDVEALMALYDEDIHRFDTWDHVEETGIDGWRQRVTDWLGAHPLVLGKDDVYEIHFDDVRATVGDDIAFVRAMMTFNVLANGVPTHTEVSRFTAGLERKDGAWKIVHEHTSLPISYDTGEGILSR